jgi:glycosyltransferase involved in cell wall biosynthesis
MSWDGDGLLIVGDQAETYGGQERVFETLLQHYPAADAVALQFPASRHYRGRPPYCSERVRGLRTPGERRSLLTPLYAARMALAPRTCAEVVLSVTQGGTAVGARTRGAARHVAYSSGPPSMYGQSELSLADERPLLRPAMRAVLPALRATYRRLLRRPDRLIANSDYSSEYLRREFGLDTEVIPPPVQTDFFTPAPRERRHWLAVGRLTAQKRFDVVLAAFESLDATLVVAGDGPARGRLEAAAPPNVRFVGFAHDEPLRELYRSAHGLICPSLETFGLVMAEALACGTPVIAQRAGGAVEFITEGVNGAFLDGVDADGVRSAVAEVEELAPAPDACRESIETYAQARFLERIDLVLEAERALALS